MSQTVMLIHGAWTTPLAWEFFQAHYESAGFTVHAPAWPFEDVPIEQLRRAPDPRLKRLTVGQLVDHYDRLIRALPEAPMIMGHSFGGLVVQKLLDRGLGVAGVALDSTPIRGVIPPRRVIRSALPVFRTWAGWNRMLEMSFETFSKTFAQTLPEGQKRVAYDRYHAPTPGRLYYQAALGIGTGVHVVNPARPPLLLVAGRSDLTITPEAVHAAYRKQQKAHSLTAYKSFAGRSHFLYAEPGWQEVADYCLHWCIEHQHVASMTSPLATPLSTRVTIAEAWHP